MELGEDGLNSGDSGNVSQSQSTASGISEEGSSGLGGGSVSLSASFLGTPEESDSSPLATECEESLREAARSYSSYMSADVSQEIHNLERSLEEMLTRVDEFVGMLDMIRNDSSQIVNENLPEIHAKESEMRQIYNKIDRLEAFVKMVGTNVAIMEEQVTQAETEMGPFPSTFKKLLRSISKMSSPKRQQPQYEPSPLFQTEDYFPCHKEQPQT